jgi:UDP-GlcNAc:undecaprenyl-phosphate/decaprenyl-phosphate GlcNAc-1-phosphate transferase
MTLFCFIVACLIPAGFLSWLLTAWMRRLAPQWGLLDQPGARKVHETATPLGGGLAIFVAFVLPIAAVQVVAWWASRQPQTPGWMPLDWVALLPGIMLRAQQLWMIIAAGTLLVVMGVLDDRLGLPWQPRLFVQLLLGVGLAVGGVRATVFAEYAWVGYVVTIVWIVVLVNAFNFLDNMDALSGGTACIAALLFAAVMLNSAAQPRWLVGGCLLVLAGALIGFLCHNWPPAKIFMGDSGSMFIGLMLACLTLVGTFYDPRESSRHVILAPLCVLAVPLYDFASVICIRLWERRNPFQPDKKHFSHRLVEMGFNKTYAVLTVHLCTLTTGIAALLLYRVGTWWDASLVVAIVLCLLLIIFILETVGRRNS